MDWSAALEILLQLLAGYVVGALTSGRSSALLSRVVTLARAIEQAAALGQPAAKAEVRDVLDGDRILGAVLDTAVQPKDTPRVSRGKAIFGAVLDSLPVLGNIRTALKR